MYVDPDYKTKKEFKAAVTGGAKLRVYNPAGYPVSDGWGVVEGPHYPKPHRWWAKVFVEDGVVVEVKS